MKTLLSILGIELHKISHTERLVSALGAFIGIYLITLTSHVFLSGNDAAFLVASMGASAVLLFAVPHSPLAQPWSLLGGHLVSALVGVTCARYIDNAFIAAPLAVGLAIGLMHYLRCIHPPGGATALTAVTGGASLQALGYAYVLTPVLLNTLIILAVSIAFNALFPWRRYPAHFKRKMQRPAATGEASDISGITHEDFVYALSQIDSIIDVSEDDLLTIYTLATNNSETRTFPLDAIKLGHYYSNGKYGDEWSVRYIVDWQEAVEPANASLIYKTVAGEGRRTSGVLSLAKFARWAKYEVYRDEENWRRVDVSAGEKS
jgi:CBS-domain-containing membrane protein